MDRVTFAGHLDTATAQAISFARGYVRQTLPMKEAFLVYPNQSCDHHPRVGDELVFPEDSLPNREDFHGPWSTGHVLAFLWRDGRVPEWIDVSVEAVDSARTLVALRCCGRFTSQGELLYYNYPGGPPPFGIKSPYLPPHWESVEISGKFDLEWRSRRDRTRPTPQRLHTSMIFERLRHFLGWRASPAKR